MPSTSPLPPSLTRRTVLAGTAAAAATVAAAAAGRGAVASTPLAVVATTGMIADTARVVGGEAVAVHALMGPGVDPHAYRATRSDIVAMTRADLVLRHGLYLEAQMADFFAKLGDRQPVLALAEVLPADRLIAHDTYEDKFDPHVWMDPALWSEVVPALEAAFAAALPSRAATFAASAAAYREELAALDAYVGRVMASVPQRSRVLVTAHDAFNYFGRAYALEVLGIQGISTESEAGLARIEHLVDTLVERQVKAVFVESSVSERNVRALVEGARARGHQVAIGGVLYSDAMGEPGTYEGTYLGMIDHNATTIAGALGGEVPERGRLGRLASVAGR